MRQGHQNKRGRGRSRKNSNPLSRNYESNGPDVKIRGSASHIAEKYASLARDAQSSGDPVSAENYWQHAEHYYRIIHAAEAQAQAKAQNTGASNNGGQRHSQGDGRGNPMRNRNSNSASDAAIGRAELAKTSEQNLTDEVRANAESKPKRKPRAAKNGANGSASANRAAARTVSEDAPGEKKPSKKAGDASSEKNAPPEDINA